MAMSNCGPSKFTQFGYRTGHVDFIDYELAVIKQTGAILDEEQGEWYLPLGFVVQDKARGPVSINRALVVYKRPEPTQVKHEVPQIVINLDDWEPDERRIFTPTVQYRLPAEGARPVSVNGCVGYSAYETKNQEWPYTFTFTIECWARYLTVAKFLKQKLMAAFPMRGTIQVLGTEEATRGVENLRTYLFFQEGFADLTELNSMVERIPGYSITIRIEGELTEDRIPQVEQAFTGGLSDTPPTGTPVNPDLPSNGLYGDGEPAVRVSFTEE